ncbi:MAG: tetratricopeptide repeat protein [Acetobacteraceae bacterium]|jgi:Tfp pilus assembly protein PilF
MTANFGEAARHYADGDLDRATAACLDIIRNDARHFEPLHLLGVICTLRGQHADGVSYLLRAEALRPNDGKVQANLGSAFGAMQRFDKSVEAYRRAVPLSHPDAELLNNLGLSLLGLGHHEKAIETFLAALAVDPAHNPALYNLARARAVAGHFAKAEADFRQLLTRLPRDTQAARIHDVLNDLARAVISQGRAEEALEILHSAAAERGDVGSLRRNEALILLLLGRFSEGWTAYETRWDAPNHDRPHPDYRVLDPDQVAGQRVLVKEEQGRGDVIQFLRYLRLLAARGARIHLSIYDDLVPLALEMPDIEVVLTSDADETEYDLLTSIMSLPLAFHTELETIPAEVPYLRTPAARIARMRHHLGPASAPRVGLIWAGSRASQARSAIPPATLEPLLRRPAIEFHCLQKELRDEDRSWLDRTGLVTTHDAMLRDFADTAALIEAMDLVISIDTAVAHLAGALAKPVWIMLAFNPDWRWMLGREDSPWYPTARLFRQSKPGDWEGVVSAVADALRF